MTALSITKTVRVATKPIGGAANTNQIAAVGLPPMVIHLVTFLVLITTTHRPEI